MDTIRSYVEGMFISLPKTPEMEQLKDEILANMEDKYSELKAQGCSENEAIGSVISDFGNIDELVRAYELDSGNTFEAAVQTVSDREISQYFTVKAKTSKLIAGGVSLCILAPALLILIANIGAFLLGGSEAAENIAGVIGICALFVFIAAAVGIFIYAGTQEESRESFMQNVTLGAGQKVTLERAYREFKSGKIIYIIIGVLLCVLSPLPLILLSLTDNELMASVGVTILLAMIAAGVPFFILYGMQLESYQKLLCIEAYANKNKKKADKIVSAVGGVVWPLVTAVFLYLGLVRNMWGSAWVIFPIVGVVFGGFSALVHALVKEQD